MEEKEKTELSDTMNIQQVADRFKVKPRTVRQWVYDGLLVAERIKGLRFTEKAIADFRQNRTVKRATASH